MKIKIIKDCEVEIAVALDAKGDAIFEPTLFKVGDILDVDVVDFGMSVKGLRKDLPCCSWGMELAAPSPKKPLRFSKA